MSIRKENAKKALIAKTDSNHTWGAGEMTEWLRVSICVTVKKNMLPKEMVLLEGMALLK